MFERVRQLDHEAAWRFMKYNQQVPHKYGLMEELAHDMQGNLKGDTGHMQDSQIKVNFQTL